MYQQSTTSNDVDAGGDEGRKAILDQLAQRIEALFCSRANQRVNKDGEWDSCLRLYHAPLVDGDHYYSDRPFEEKAGRKRPTPNIVRTKCDTAVSNSVSMQFAADEKNWDMFPPANVTSTEVADACRKMEKEIQSQLDSCNYPMHARRAIEDRVILGTGILKGPVNTGRLTTKYVKQGDTWVPTVVRDFTPTVERVPPWRFYPDMDVADYCDSADTIELHPMTTIELALKRKHPGFDKDVIQEILEKEATNKPENYNNEYLKSLNSRVWDAKYMYKDRYAVIEYHGPVTYDEVEKLGLCPTYQSPTKEYYGEIWVCCGKVIRMELENIEAQYETPYSVAIWKRDPTSPFGFGHPLLLADAQRVITESYHMILDNASLTSGPQVAMFQQYIQPVDNDYTIRPNKVWLLSDPTVSIKDAISFFTPDNVIENILPVLALARSFADEESATTATAAGLASPQNVESATGQLVMAQNSTTLLDFLAEEWDDQVTEKIIRRFYGWNMQYNPDESIKGDFVIDVKSSSEYKNKQMHIRDLERLSMETQQNPQMALWINQGELQKARLALMHLPSSKIVRTNEEHAEAEKAASQQPNPQMIELQIKMEEVKQGAEELQMKREQLEFEKFQSQQREAWEFQEKQGSNYARVQEAQAQVIKARSEVEVEQLKLAAKDRQLLAKMQADSLAVQNSNDSKVFMHSMTENRKTQEALLNASLFKKELDYAQKEGKGV